MKKEPGKARLEPGSQVSSLTAGKKRTNTGPAGVCEDKPGVSEVLRDV